MSIPINTTVIEVYSTTGTGDAYEEETRALVAGNVRAVIGRETGTRLTAPGGTDNTLQYSLTCDPTTINPGDKVIDLVMATEYNVLWSMTRPGPLSYTAAGLELVTHG